MAEKSPRRPQTPKTGPNTIRRDQNEEEILKKLYEQRLGDELSPHDDLSFEKSGKRDKSPRRAQTPKKEEHGPHGIIADKSAEKAVKKIHKQLHPQDHSIFKGIFGGKRDKSPKRPQRPHRPPTPMKDEKAARNVVSLNEQTKEVIENYLIATDPLFRPDPRPETDLSEEIGEAKPKKGQVSPISPHPSPMFPTEETAKPIDDSKKSAPKYSVQEALMSAQKVGEVAFPAADTAEHTIKEEHQPRGGLKFVIRKLSFSKKKPKQKPEEPLSEISTHTSHESTSLPSSMFEDRLSETWTPSTLTPASDMTPARLARVSEDGDSLSDSFPSEVDEGAVGGEEFEIAVYEQGEDDSGAARGRFRPVRVVNYETGNDKLDKRRSKDYAIYRCRGLALYTGSDDHYRSYGERTLRKMREQSEGDDTQPRRISSISGTFDELHLFNCTGPFYDEEASPSASELQQSSPKRGGREERKAGSDPAKMEPVKKGVLHTPDGSFDVYYRVNPNNEVTELRIAPRSPRGATKQSTRPSEELSRQRDERGFQSTLRKTDMERPSSSEDSVPESQSSTPRTSISQTHVDDESSTGAGWFRRVRSYSDISSDSDPEMDF